MAQKPMIRHKTTQHPEYLSHASQTSVKLTTIREIQALIRKKDHLNIKKFELNAMLNLLSFGNSHLKIVANRIIPEAIIEFIDQKNLFD